MIKINSSTSLKRIIGCTFALFAIEKLGNWFINYTNPGSLGSFGLIAQFIFYIGVGFFLIGCGALGLYVLLSLIESLVAGGRWVLGID
jgi:hypothetical protein